jgi:hypothetical protein
VETALTLGLLLPPPAPGALMLARSNRTRAGLTTDRDEAHIVQRVIGDLMATDRDVAVVLGDEHSHAGTMLIAAGAR